MRVSIIVLSIMLLSGCGITTPNFGLDSGLDGCVHIQLENFQGGPVHADKLSYHRVNDKCKGMEYHGHPSPEVG